MFFLQLQIRYEWPNGYVLYVYVVNWCVPRYRHVNPVVSARLPLKLGSQNLTSKILCAVEKRFLFKCMRDGGGEDGWENVEKFLNERGGRERAWD